MTEATIIAHTANWIKTVVMGCNFCPFAAQAVLKDKVRYVVVSDASVEHSLETLLAELRHLDQSPDVETTLLIFPNHFEDFGEYLDLVDLAEALTADQHYEGIYQVASFHPRYCFDSSDELDPANYTNRSIYPMLHILREESVEAAIDSHPDAEGIPARNVTFAQGKGLAYMQWLRASCMES